jgi:hypothetical protein
MRNIIYLIVILALMWHFASRDDLGAQIGWELASLAPTTRSALAPNEPTQVNLAEGEVASWRYKGFTFTPLATYLITARVLHRDQYPPSSDGFAVVCPLDLALGWGRMSNPSIYGALDIGQVSRHYSWQTSMFDPSAQLPIPQREVECSSANTHVIPANGDVDKELENFHPGDVIRLSGYLVQFESPDGWIGRSSMVRTDTGDGSCEIMWVNRAEMIGR